METTVEEPLVQSRLRIVEQGAGEARDEQQRAIDQGLDIAGGQAAGAALVDDGVNVVAAVEGHRDRGPVVDDQTIVAGAAVDDDRRRKGAVEDIDRDRVIAVAGVDRERGAGIREVDFFETAGAVAVYRDLAGIGVIDEADLLVAGGTDREDAVGGVGVVRDRLEAGIVEDRIVERDDARIRTGGHVVRTGEDTAFYDQ